MAVDRSSVVNPFVEAGPESGDSNISDLKFQNEHYSKASRRISQSSGKFIRQDIVNPWVPVTSKMSKTSPSRHSLEGDVGWANPFSAFNKASEGPQPGNKKTSKYSVFSKSTSESGDRPCGHDDPDYNLKQDRCSGSVTVTEVANEPDSSIFSVCSASQSGVSNDPEKYAESIFSKFNAKTESTASSDYGPVNKFRRDLVGRTGPYKPPRRSSSGNETNVNNKPITNPWLMNMDAVTQNPWTATVVDSKADSISIFDKFSASHGVRTQNPIKKASYPKPSGLEVYSSFSAPKSPVYRGKKAQKLKASSILVKSLNIETVPSGANSTITYSVFSESSVSNTQNKSSAGTQRATDSQYATFNNVNMSANKSETVDFSNFESKNTSSYESSEEAFAPTKVDEIPLFDLSTGAPLKEALAEKIRAYADHCKNIRSIFTKNGGRPPKDISPGEKIFYKVENNV